MGNIQTTDLLIATNGVIHLYSKTDGTYLYIYIYGNLTVDGDISGNLRDITKDMVGLSIVDGTNYMSIPLRCTSTAVREDRIQDLRIVRPARCQLCYRRMPDARGVRGPSHTPRCVLALLLHLRKLVTWMRPWIVVAHAVLEMGLEPTISSLGGRRLIH